MEKELKDKPDTKFKTHESVSLIIERSIKRKLKFIGVIENSNFSNIANEFLKKQLELFETENPNYFKKGIE